MLLLEVFVNSPLISRFIEAGEIDDRLFHFIFSHSKVGHFVVFFSSQ